MKKIVYANLFIVSFVIMGLEMTATRLIAPTFGNTVYTWGIIITIFLVGSSVGYVLGGRVADSEDARLRTFMLYFISILFICLIPWIKHVSFPMFKHLSSLQGTIMGVMFLYFIPNLLLSSIVPVLMKEGMDDKVSGKVIGNLHTSSALGSVLGTLVTTFFFIRYMSINTVIGMLVLLLAIVFVLYFIPNPPVRKKFFTFLIPFIIITFLPVQPERQGLIFHETSLYHDIYVYETDNFRGRKGDFRYLTFGNSSTIQGMVDMDNRNDLIFDYTQNIWELTERMDAGNDGVFILGHGVGSLTRKYEKYSDNVIAAELDEKVAEISREYFGYKGEGVQIGDGRKLLYDVKSEFDLIILDAFHDTKQIPFHLVTKEFFQLTKTKLAGDGMLFINAIGTPKNDEFLESLNTTLKDVYPYVYVLGEKKVGTSQNLVLIASDSPLVREKLSGFRLFDVKEGQMLLDEYTSLDNVN
ncbi:fused MFS/spermidine synthase (plasmid) [Rossellomorea sp. AcN35-11]|nr:fused MFS/spermidine synthase [Rossellomorea aquimaris]WJV32076.1 fused MFS/spermidine synthase [Rossellomorea sp. AcN35-11]